MFNIESYVTPILLSYVDKYVRDFKPADAQVSLWAGGVTLHNLVLKADVLQKEVALPFTLVSGRIHELLIQVPWTKIMSEPIVVTINTIECILSLNPPPEETPRQEQSRTQVVEAPPGYMQALVRRIVSNIAVRVHSLIVKYVHDDVVLSLNVKRLAVDSVGTDWEPLFADIDQNQPAIRRLVRLDDLTLCLDKSDADGKIRFYQEPLLYRCQLDLRVLTRLVSANTRRARSLTIQLRSSRLAWGVTTEQMVLLLRLFRERTLEKVPPPIVKTTSASMVAPLHPISSNNAEPARSGSWSEWAWSWLPTWMDREGVEEAPAPAAPVPVAFTAHLDLVSLVFKIMETESNNRKRSRGILEVTCTDAVIKSALCSPTLIRVRAGARAVSVHSHGKCVCGHVDINANNEEPTIYLNKVVSEHDIPWSWEDVELNDQVVETAVAADEELGEGTETVETEASEKPQPESRPVVQLHDEGDQFWQKMAPVVYFEYNHDRTPLNDYVNPYDNPPRDFEYSDWIEDSNVKISIRPILISITTGLLHRLAVLKNVLQEVPPPADIETSMRTLTVEECEALSENLPQRHTAIDITGLRVRVSPWDHSLVDKPMQPPLLLDLQLPKATVLITGPLYPHRVCSAACQLPEDSGPLWQGANLHVSATVTAVQLGVCTHDTPRPCARADLRFVTHTLLNSTYFGRDSVIFSYNLKIREANLCGSSARLQAAYQVLNSVVNEKFSTPLRHSTLAKDALGDEESVAIDMTLEELSIRGYLTRNINTHIVSMHCARATAFHSPSGGVVRQAWLFSAPEAPTTSPYLRVAVQWCNEPGPDSLEYAGVWVEPTAVSVDPLLVAWLGYRPRLKSTTESVPQVASVRTVSSSQYIRRRVTPPSSSGRGGSRSGSGAELVHVRPRSQESSSERSERKDSKQAPKMVKAVSQWTDEKLLKLHERLNRLLLTAEVGLVLIYVTSVSVSAVDCATVRDAMERHAESAHRVLVVSLGRLSMHSNTQTKHLWQEVRHDRPTLRRPKVEQNVIEDSFPWKIRLADVSCYTLEVMAGTGRLGRDKSASGLRSQLKSTGVPVPRTVLEMVTTSITLSVVTKTLQIKTRSKVDVKHKHTEAKEEDRTKFFTTGVDFKPSSLKEFIRGPIRRKKTPEPEETHEVPEPAPPMTIKSGPVVSLGINLHADTPPVLVRLDQDQVQAVSVAIHCFTHLMSLLTRPPLSPRAGFSSFGSSHKSLIRSVSELEARQSVSEEASDNHSEQLISIFESRQVHRLEKLKTFFWFQWVVSRATMVVATPEVKLAFVVDDVISTVDLQDHYNQLKIKVASASVRHYKRTGSEEWSPGVLGGRILEVREPTNAKEENHFLAVTITQARISNLPVSWKEELHPKLLEQNSNVDSMWEVYATLAPLEAVLQPDVLDHMLCWLHELTPRALCPLRTDDDRPSTWQWPFCYVSAGGLRLLLTNGEPDGNAGDDTFVLVVGKITVNPHPENPILRQGINTTADMSWSSPAPGLEGRQYEVLIKNLAIRSARFSQLVNEEATESEILKGTGGENPALKWSQPIVSPVITPVLHSMDVSCVLAPTIYSCGAVTCGAAWELNLLTDCAIELAVSRLSLLHALVVRFAHALRLREESSFELDEDTSCPYAAFLTNVDVSDSSPADSEATLFEGPVCPDGTKSALDVSRSLMFDSGFETVTSHSTYKFRRESSTPIKKSVSIAGVDYTAKASDYLELFITMGTIDVSLYANDDDSQEIAALKPPPGAYRAPEPEQVNQIKVTVVEEKEMSKVDEGKDSMTASKSLTETIRNVDIGKTKLEQMHILPFARKTEGNVPLLHATLQQPNFYYRKRKKQKTIQISVFNAWVGLGAGADADSWSAALVSTAAGAPDPVTEIPPALATLRIELATGGYMALSVNPKGTIQLEVERPILFEVSSDRIRRLKGIVELMKKNLEIKQQVLEQAVENKPSFLYRMRRYMVGNQIESMTIQTGQLGVRGSEGVAGWSALRVQVAAGVRPEKLCCRVLLTAVLVSAGPPTDCRHILLQPMMAGAILDGIWEAWRRAEGGQSAKDPTIRIGIDLDQITLDLRPGDLATLNRIHKTLQESLGLENISTSESQSSESVNVENVHTTSSSFTSQFTSDTSDYYKDDLRSGAFKIVSGGQLPMAYQVTLHGSTVAWRYPHPRAITRLVAFPIPGHVEEVECALELYCPLLCRWEAHTYFQLPVAEPRETQLSMAPAEAVFALMWRVRACSDRQPANQPFVFDARKFMPRSDPLAGEPVVESDYYRRECAVSAEQVAGALRVDSYFAPRQLPRARLALRLAGLDLHAHNDLPRFHKLASVLEGYYVSRPLMRSHRVLSLSLRDSSAHAVFAAAPRVLLDSHISSELIDSATGTMQTLIQEFRVQGTLSLCGEPRLRLRAGDVRVALHVPGVSTLKALADDWLTVYNEQIKNKTEEREVVSTNQSVQDVVKYLDGRVSLWVHNCCAVALRVGQEGTDEIVPLSSGAALAYRWRSPTTAKKLRFALASPAADWQWSSSIPFSGSTRVRVGDVFVYVQVTDAGSRRDMYLSGRLVLANVLRHNLLYKVRARCSEKKAWQTISSGDLHAESVGLSVLCNADCETILKVKFTSHECGWSGDIPLKECRKENVPWLVKVPSAGEVSYTSVWCRVVRGRGDARVLATIWPFYILRSHLPLDADVLISSDTGQAQSTEASPPIIQTASGRGTTTHLIAPGTTAARHTLTFQYRNIECPVTREAVPLHYGVTDTSVFEKPSPVSNIEEVVDIVQKWLRNNGKDNDSSWPYSLVTSHWPGKWSPALLQPRCDVSVRYAAVRAAGGCSLELRLCPVALLANASPVSLTLRAHDAAPLCRLEPGVAIAPPSAVVQKPFFISVEMGRETFVSGQLRVCKEDPGRYGNPAPGHVVLDRSTDFAIQCNQKVALLTMYYEIKEDINVLGITSTFILINRLHTDILVSAIAIPNEMDTHSVLRPKTFKVVQPTKAGTLQGTPLCRFWVRGRWRGGDAEELRTFLCLALPTRTYPAITPVPVALGVPPVRRAVALRDESGQSVCVVVSQVRHEARWVVTVSPDPCPQLVVHNRTATTLAVAEPVPGDAPHSAVQAVSECPGVRWWCNVEAGRLTHYSSPAHCARYPPPANAPRLPLPALTVGRTTDDGDLEWSQPIAIAEGEQLLQLTGGMTIKVRVRTHPHSSLVELQDVDEHDISASDIRRRLLGVFSEESMTAQEEKEIASCEQNELARTSADDKLLSVVEASVPSQETTDNKEPEEVTLLSADQQTDLLSASQLVTDESLEAEKSSEDKDPKSTDQVVLTVDTEWRRDMPATYNSEIPSAVTVVRHDSTDLSETSYLLEDVYEKDCSISSAGWAEVERARCVVGSVAVTLRAAPDVLPLLALHLQRAALIVHADARRIRTTLSISDVQVDNAQYENEQYDFAVIATTRAEAAAEERWPPLWGMAGEVFSSRCAPARLLLRTCQDKWTIAGRCYNELTEVELRVGPLGLYVEDAFLGAAVELFHLAVPVTTQTSESLALAECRTLQNPVRLRKLHIYPLNLTLTLHTAVRMYIALDESPLRLGAFSLHDVMTSPERLTHALTVHYLSAAILGAGWVVGGLELLGAPGALAARVGSAGGGVRGVASAAAAALLRSLSAAAGSLARNLDLLAGDHEHARRAAAARRRPPPSLMAGLVAGITNFAINILGAVGGLAHHPLVGVAVGESGSGAAALRRGILGAITKPLSATADLVAYAGHGLLTQTGWDTIPRARECVSWSAAGSGWRRDCVRWSFRLAELSAVAGYDALLDNAPVHLLITHKFLVIADPETERIVEMIDFKFCTLVPYQGQIIELHVSHKRSSRVSESRVVVDEDNEYQVSAAAMARVARYTGAEGYNSSEARVLSLLPAPGAAHALHAALAAGLQHNTHTHFPFM